MKIIALWAIPIIGKDLSQFGIFMSVFGHYNFVWQHLAGHKYIKVYGLLRKTSKKIWVLFFLFSHVIQIKVGLRVLTAR